MARFSRKLPQKPRVVRNLAGGSGYRESAELELASLLLTSFAQDQFYRSAPQTFEQLANLIAALPDKSFAARAALFARNEYGMRSITHATAATIGAQVKGADWLRPFFKAIVRRPDDMTETAAFYLATYGKPLPNAMKRGFADAFSKFDEYALAKYRGEGHEVSLVDIVNLVHPKPLRGKNFKALKALMSGKLKSTETWEAKLTAAMGDAELRNVAWEDLLRNHKLGYFALLRNLRNIYQQAPNMLDEALAQLTDKDAIKKSLVMPFRFQTAYEELRQDVPNKVLLALSAAAEVALSNVPKMPGRTLVAIDASGSMYPNVAPKAALFAVVLHDALNADMLAFSDNASMVVRNAPEPGGLLHDALALSGTLAARFNGGTNFLSIFERLTKVYDRIIILSDMQGWAGGYHGDPKQALASYRARTGADPFIYSFDLQGYGTLMFPQPKVHTIAGFSDKIFDLFLLLEEDKNALVNRIKGVPLV